MSFRDRVKRSASKLAGQVGLESVANATKGLPWWPDSIIPRAQLPISRLRHQIYMVLVDPTSKCGYISNILVTLAILLSVVLFCVQTLPQYRLRNIQVRPRR